MSVSDSETAASDAETAVSDFETGAKWRKAGQSTGARHGRCGGKARVTEFPRGRSPPDTPPGGQGTGMGGASPPQTPPRQHFKKFALPGKFFEMIKVVVNYFHY